MNCGVHGHVRHVTYLYFIRTVINFFVRDVHREFGLINVHLFDILRTIFLEKSGKVDFFYCLER